MKQRNNYKQTNKQTLVNQKKNEFNSTTFNTYLSMQETVLFDYCDVFFFILCLNFNFFLWIMCVVCHVTLTACIIVYIEDIYISSEVNSNDEYKQRVWMPAQLVLPVFKRFLHPYTKENGKNWANTEYTQLRAHCLPHQI